MSILKKTNGSIVVKKKRTLFQKIVNIFIIFLIFLTFAIIGLLFFLQTNTFRTYLKNLLVEEVNKNLNGKIDLAKIDGSIISSIILRDLRITLEGQEILNVKKIQLNYQPHNIIFKTLIINKLEIDSLKAAIIKDKDSIWNFSKLPISKEKGEEIDTVKALDYYIKIKSFKIVNANIRYFDELQSISDNSKFSDLNFQNLNLDFSASLDFSKEKHRLNLNNLMFELRPFNFKLNKFNFNFLYDKNFVSLSHFNIETENNKLNLNANLNFPASILSSNISIDSILNKTNYKLELNFESDWLGDFSLFDSELEKIQAPIKIYSTFEGENLLSAKIKKFDVFIGKNSFGLSGYLFRLDTIPYFDLNFNLSSFNYSDFNKSLEYLSLPDLKNLKIDSLNLSLRGFANDFNATLNSKIGKGTFLLNAKLDLQKDTLIESKVFLRNFDLKPFANIHTNLNLNFLAQARKFDLNSLTANLSLSSYMSMIGSYNLDTLEMFANFEKGNGSGNIKLISDTTSLKINYGLGFVKNIPNYFIECEASKLSLGKLTENNDLKDELNFSFNLQAAEFDIKNIKGVLNFYLEKSKIADRIIYPTQIQIILEKQNNLNIASIKSEFVDFRLIGNFNLSSLGDNLSKLSKGLSDIFERKKAEFYGDISPFVNMTPKGKKVYVNLIDEKKDLMIVEPVNADYFLKFKNIQKASYLIFGEEKKIDLQGEINGKLYFDTAIVIIHNNADIRKIKIELENEPILISNLKWNFYLNSLSKDFSSENLKTIFNLKNDYIFTENIIENAHFAFNYSNEKAEILVKATIDSAISSNIFVRVDLSKSRIDAEIDTLDLKIANRDWKIIEPTFINYSFEEFQLSNFYLASYPALFNLSTKIGNDGKIDAFFFADNIDGEFVRTLFLNLPKNYLSFNIRTGVRISGYLHKPKLAGEFDVEKLKYGESFIGDIRSYYMYDKGAFTSELSAYNDYLLDEMPYFGIYLYALSDFSIYPFKFDRDDKDIIFEIGFNKLNLEKFNGLIPALKNIKGTANGNIAAKGGGGEIIYDGKFEISNASFKSTLNNMSYSFNLKSVFKDNYISFDEIKISNIEDTKYPGSLIANGRVEFDGLNIKKISLKTKGSLAALNKSSQETMKIIYGDLAISTGGDVYYLYENNKSYISGAINIAKMDLTILPIEQRGSDRKNEFVYKFIDTLEQESQGQNLETETSVYKKIRKKKLDKEISGKSESGDFVYDLRIRTLENAIVNIIISRQMNFKLRLEMDGDLSIENRANIQNIQGEFKLLQGSVLEFLKTFEAYGSVKFEGNLSDPMLNIVAFYQNEYFEPTDSLRTNPIDVMVAVKLQGPVSDVLKNFANKKDNIVVYYGAQNIQSKTPDNTKDASDAISFVIVGKFKNDLTAADKSNISQSNVFSSSAVSILGSALSQFANQYLGDFVKNIELRQSTRGETRFNISGKYEKLRYTFGSSLNSSNNADLTSEATFKLEYLFNPSFLLRLERKDPLAERYGNVEKILELGIKYRYEF